MANVPTMDMTTNLVPNEPVEVQNGAGNEIPTRLTQVIPTNLYSDQSLEAQNESENEISRPPPQMRQPRRVPVSHIALDMIRRYPILALLRDRGGETALHVLARKRSAFPCKSDNGGIWKKFMFSIPGMKQVGRDIKQIQALQLLKCIWLEVLKQDEDGISDHIGYPSRLLMTAAKIGNTGFLIKLIRLYPDLLWKVDEDRQGIFHYAVLYRHESLFSIIHEIGSIKEIITSYRDKENNSFLHLAGMLPPSRELNVVPGVAFQMQRELLWFKAVESLWQPAYKEKTNDGGKTAQELFTKSHERLVKEGEEWMKMTASQAMIVATLIATVVFAAAFTVPGGNKGDTGIPTFLGKSSFMIFAISDALALFTSSTSILTFLSIITSRYAEEDFLKSLPTKLVIGLTTLFVSIIAMTVAFSATFFVLYLKEFNWVPITITLFACAPIILFVRLQYSLFVDTIRWTFRSKTLFKPKKPICFTGKVEVVIQ